MAILMRSPSHAAERTLVRGNFVFSEKTANTTDSIVLKCCAFDYMTHTLDGASSLLHNPKYFPARVTMPSGASQQFSNIARRLYRVFAHAYFHHRSTYFTFENDCKVHARFREFVTSFDLMSKDAVLVPSENVELKAPQI
jgi:hypothetical protein